MRKAIISDIHGNLPALKRVLKDIDSQNIDAIYNLGDIFGCKNPEADAACLDILMDRVTVNVMGNKDLEVLLNEQTLLGTDADRETIFQTHHILLGTSSQQKKRWDFLNCIPYVYFESNKIMYFHGSPLDPLQGLLARHDVHDTKRMDLEFCMIHYLGFHGHTHSPEVISSEKVYLEPENKLHPSWIFPKAPEKPIKYFIGVGSVGDPRGWETHLAYAILEETEDAFHLQFRLLEPLS
ncbi:MAG: metallophosphoesterase family protein [Planctomycetia bacterium]|nr:metallophosphoesterase family protein [Planctomycetia bacterium]